LIRQNWHECALKTTALRVLINALRPINFYVPLFKNDEHCGSLLEPRQKKKGVILKFEDGYWRVL